MYEGRTIKIKFHDLISFLALYVAAVCATNGELRYTDSQLVYYVPFIFCLVALLMELMVHRIVVSSYLIWRVLMIVFLVIATVYALDADVAFTGTKTYLLQSIVVLLIAVKCSDDPTCIRKIMMIFLLATLTTAIYIMTLVNPSQIASGERLGVGTINAKWNANNIGLFAAFGMLLAFCTTFVFNRKPTRGQVIFSVVTILLFTYLLIVSGSRKSVLIILVTVLLYIMSSQKSKRVRNTIIAVILMLLALYAIYNVPFLYEHLGVRFESMVESLFGEGGDKSSMIRQHMIEIGWDAFREKPLLGYGVNSYSVIYRDRYNVLAYSHNNYIEMLVTGGLVGLLLYYVYIVKILTRKCADNKYTAFVKAALIAILIADVGCVSYYDPFIQYVLCVLVYGVIYNPTITKMYSPQISGGNE